MPLNSYKRKLRPANPLPAAANGLAVVLRGARMLNELGYLDDRQLKRLKSMIEALPASVTTVVVMTHHPVARASGDSANVPSLSLLTLSTLVSQLYNSP